MVFVELPEVGKQVSAGDDCAVAESVKAASDIYSPVSGEIIAVNDELEGSPELVNSDPYEAGWLFRIKLDDESELANLLDAEALPETWWTKSNAPGPCTKMRGPFIWPPAGQAPVGGRVKSSAPVVCQPRRLGGKRAGPQQGDPLLMLSQHPVPHPVCGTRNMSGVGINRRSGTSGLGYQG